MLRKVVLAAVATAVGGIAVAQKAAPGDGPGWTGATQPHDVILARQALMTEIEALMRPIDTYTVGDGGGAGDDDPERLAATANTISVMLLAVPHLFPPTTNVYDPDSNATETLALPAVWESFDTFYELATAAADAATTMAGLADPDSLRTAALALRGACDACHALYLKPYERSDVTEEDRNFDFEQFLPPQ